DESEARNQIERLFVAMQAWSTVVVTLATLMVATVDAKIYERWLCVAHYESGFDTSFVDHNSDGSSEYGIFQLNSAWWCNNGVTSTQNLCHMNCNDLLNNHITDDIMCAKHVVTLHKSMNAWDSWNQHCAGHDLSEWLKGCDVHMKTDSSNTEW
ncbi:hypothetical protein STEG23_025814, partial [Scotinomys teguina]